MLGTLLGLDGKTAIGLTFYAGSHWFVTGGIPLTLEEQKELLALTPVETKIQCSSRRTSSHRKQGTVSSRFWKSDIA